MSLHGPLNAERVRQTQRDRRRDRQRAETETARDRVSSWITTSRQGPLNTETDRHTDRVTDRQTDRDRDRDRQTERETETKKDRDREREVTAGAIPGLRRINSGTVRNRLGEQGLRARRSAVRPHTVLNLVMFTREAEQAAIRDNGITFDLFQYSNN